MLDQEGNELQVGQTIVTHHLRGNGVKVAEVVGFTKTKVRICTMFPELRDPSNVLIR